jgi:pimeloyl-ACP methyl ester carboxylesterase
MGRGWKIAIGAVVALAVLLGLNALVVGKETKGAEVTVPGGRILELPGADLQVVDRGPRGAPPIVLVHCFTCAIDWWDRMMPMLERRHRVVAVDLLGHGGSEKPDSGYTVENQADLVAQALSRLGVRDAVVVGHSLGGAVAVALASQSPQLADRVFIVDTRSSAHDEGDLGILARLASAPVLGEALWRTKPDFAVRKGLEVAFAPGFGAYDESPSDDYTDERSLAERMAATGKPLMVIMGSEEQIIDDPRAVLAAYEAAAPSARTKLIDGAGHSPNVEQPARTAALVLAFAADEKPAKRVKRRNGMQARLQKSEGVRSRP